MLEAFKKKKDQSRKTLLWGKKTDLKTYNDRGLEKN